MEYKELIISVFVFLGSLIGSLIGAYVGFRYAVKRSEKHKKGVTWSVMNDKDFPKPKSSSKLEIVTTPRQMYPRQGYNNRRPPQR